MAKKYEIDPVWMERYGHEPTYEEIFRFWGQPVPKLEPPHEAKYAPEDSCRFRQPKLNTGCSALKDTYCRYGKCNFYKTREQYDEERKKYVSDKYGGK